MEVQFKNAIKIDNLKKIGMITPRLYIPESKSIIRKNVVKYKNKYYYHKKATLFELINELIGSVYAKEIDLDAVHYEVVDGDNYSVMSQVFYNMLYEYNDATEINYDIITSLKDAIKGKHKIPIGLETLYDDIMKLTALDLKMGQVDRNATNIIMQKSKFGIGDMSLAPTFDFGCSYYNDTNIYYTNPYVEIKKTPEDMYDFALINPSIEEYLTKLNNISITDILENISSNYDVEFDDNIKKYYKNRENINNKLFQKI